MRAVTAETMQALDRQTIDLFGVAGMELMERAGRQVVEVIRSRFSDVARRSVVILAGKGNNGGDGFVIARLLAEDGWLVTLLTFGDVGALAGDARGNFERLPASVVRRDFCGITGEDVDACLDGAAIVIDALLGTGLKKAPSDGYAAAIKAINDCGRPVVAVDIPSGVDATSGEVRGEAVKARITVTFGAAKTGQFIYPGAEHIGELIVADIGIPGELLDKASFVRIVDEAYAASLLLPRAKTAHKGSFGHCLVVAGSPGKSGAATMAANSAMRSGAGLVTLAVPATIHAVVEIKTTEVMTVPLPDTSTGNISVDSLRVVRKLLVDKSAVAIGPGLGMHGETGKIVREIVSLADLPLVLDADALNVVAKDVSCLKSSLSPALVLTPHPGEMSRMAGCNTAAIESDRIGAAKQFAAANNCFLLLKGARTVIAAPDGRTAINTSGNAGMASGGMGDVLTGIIAALLGQGYDPFAACCLGAFSHGLAGDMAADEKGEIGLIATDLQEMLPCAFQRLARRQELRRNL